MPQVPVQFGEWRPDISTLDTQFANDVENVFPGSNSYLPVPSLIPFGQQPVPPPPSTERVVGAVQARTTAGEWVVFAGTPTKLYRWTMLSGWIDVTGTGGPFHVPEGELWSWAQFGKWMIAAQIGDAPQRCDIDAGTPFEPLPGSPPIAHNVHVCGDFVVLGGLASNRNQIIWCSINDPTAWVIGINLCDMQEFPDGGPVMGVAGDKIAYVVQDRCVRNMQFLPSDITYIFTFSKVVYDRGSVSEFGYCMVGDTLYLLCEDGFYAVAGTQLLPIGWEKVNEWFLAHSDEGRRNLVQCVPAIKPYIFWAYHSSPAVNYYDTVILFNWNNQRWSRIKANAQMWATLATVNVDLDTDFGPEMPEDAQLDSNARSLDSFAYKGGRPRVAAIDENGYLVELNGPPLQATIESGEAHLVPGQRAMVGDVYPLADGAGGVIYQGGRERLQDDVVWSQAFPIEGTGSAAVYVSSRLHRFRHVIPRDTEWTHALGVVADAQPDGFVA